MSYNIEVTESAFKDLEQFKPYQQKAILDTIEEQLKYEPGKKTRNRKPLRPNSIASWELRVRDYRVFYGIEEQSKQVTVVSIGEKIHNKLLIRGEEVQL